MQQHEIIDRADEENIDDPDNPRDPDDFGNPDLAQRMEMAELRGIGKREFILENLVRFN